MDILMTAELIQKAKEAKSAEEIQILAKESGYDMTIEEANEYFEQLHKTGEISDEELGNVSGGGCKTGVDGVNYTIVTSESDCFTGQFLSNFCFIQHGSAGQGYVTTVYSHDREGLRRIWSVSAAENECGACAHLQFKPGTCTGYCELSGK